MTGIMNLQNLLKDMSPQLSEEEFVFCSLKDVTDDELVRLKPLCFFKEPEGTTVVLNKYFAIENDFTFDEVFKRITLEVHSSLIAVGLTAAVSTALADRKSVV